MVCITTSLEVFSISIMIALLEKLQILIAC